MFSIERLFGGLCAVTHRNLQCYFGKFLANLPYLLKRRLKLYTKNVALFFYANNKLNLPRTVHQYIDDCKPIYCGSLSVGSELLGFSITYIISFSIDIVVMFLVEICNLKFAFAQHV